MNYSRLNKPRVRVDHAVLRQALWSSIVLLGLLALGATRDFSQPSRVAFHNTFQNYQGE